MGQGGEEGEVHLLEVQDDRVVVQNLDAVQVLGIGFDVGPQVRGGALQRELDVLRLQLLAVVELHALAEVHLVRRVGDKLPLLGQTGAEGAVVVQEDEGVVDLMTGAGTGIIVVTDGIERGRVVLVGHDQRVPLFLGRRLFFGRSGFHRRHRLLLGLEVHKPSNCKDQHHEQQH